MTITPVTLIGNVVRLEPLTMEHHAGLSEVGLDPELWRWSTAPVRTPDDLRKYMETAVLWREQGTAIPFTTVEKSSNRIVGSTRFALSRKLPRTSFTSAYSVPTSRCRSYFSVRASAGDFPPVDTAI